MIQRTLEQYFDLVCTRLNASLLQTQGDESFALSLL